MFEVLALLKENEMQKFHSKLNAGNTMHSQDSAYGADCALTDKHLMFSDKETFHFLITISITRIDLRSNTNLNHCHLRQYFRL